jgi:hypothetical protein
MAVGMKVEERVEGGDGEDGLRCGCVLRTCKTEGGWIVDSRAMDPGFRFLD